MDECGGAIIEEDREAEDTESVEGVRSRRMLFMRNDVLDISLVLMICCDCKQESSQSRLLISREAYWRR